MRLLLDANVLVDAQLRDLFLRFADAELISIAWSARILGETARALEMRLGLTNDRAERVVEVMRRAFPEAEVEGYGGLIDTIELPDDDDWHVVAAALTGRCSAVVTANLRDFPEHCLSRRGLVAMHPDAALTAIIVWHGPAVRPAVDALLAGLTRPSMTEHEFLLRLARRTPTAAEALTAALRGGRPHMD